MSFTFGDFVGKVLRVLGDPEGDIFEDDIIFDGCVAAHEAILPWSPKKAVATIVTDTTSGSLGGGGVYALPSDCYQMQSVQTLSDGSFLPKATLASGTARNVGNSAYNDWIEYPYGSISLSEELLDDEEIKLYYFAHWSAPASDTDQTFVFEVPPQAYIGMVYYAGAHCLMPKAVDAAQIRQFNQRMDSGNPEHNPLKVEAKYLLERFYAEMKLLPPYTRVAQ
jgi:hypothetical protein